MADETDIMDAEFTETEHTTAAIEQSIGETPAEQTSERESRSLITAAESIPVGNVGAMPVNFAQQVDYAQYMAKANAAIPPHLRGNVGACLAVMDIAQRAGGLSPYMVANKTYVQNDSLCFESQLFHALAEKSGLLKGKLRVSYDGEGDERTCTVTGYLAGEDEPHTYTSPALKDLHPGHTEKNGRKFVKGSPLWDRKPDVQMFYDTCRDWVRMFAPLATLGIYTPEEIERGEQEIMRDVTPALTRERVSTADRSEGFRDGHVNAELADAMPANRMQEVLPAKEATPAQQTTEAKPAKKPEPTKTKTAAKSTKKTDKPADKPEPKSAVQKQAEAAQAAMPTGKPKTSAEYGMYAANKIDEFTDYDKAREWWDSDDERDLRDNLEVPIKTRTQLANKIDDKFLN